MIIRIHVTCTQRKLPIKRILIHPLAHRILLKYNVHLRQNINLIWYPFWRWCVISIQLILLWVYHKYIQFWYWFRLPSPRLRLFLGDSTTSAINLSTSLQFVSPFSVYYLPSITFYPLRPPSVFPLKSLTHHTWQVFGVNRPLSQQEILFSGKLTNVQGVQFTSVKSH